MTARCLRCSRPRKELEVHCTYCGGPFTRVADRPFSRNIRDNFPYIRNLYTLGEGNTPFLESGGISYKLDFLNPTGSYKDRGSATLLSFLRENGVSRISEDSSGNAGASIAAYGALLGMEVSVFVPDTVKGAKLRQIESYGARVTRVQGTRSDVSRAAESSRLYFASHVWQPEFRDGIRTLAYEISRDLGWKAPDNVFLPTSAGTLLLGVYSGFHHMLESGEIERMPRLVAVQSEQVSPVYSALKGVRYEAPAKITSRADALVSTNPVFLPEMVAVLSECGDALTVSEDEIVSAHTELARKGLLVEYSSATAYAAALRYPERGRDVVVLTGSGLKTL
jgi:threonine synthase